MKQSNPLAFVIKYTLWGLLIGFLILFFMPNSRLSFNWLTAQQAWHYFKTNSQDLGQNSQPFSINDISFSDAVETASPSVVSITVFRHRLLDSDELPEGEKILERGLGIGSGIILSERGYIVTNYHVIANADQVSINLQDGRKRLVDIVGYDIETDIAILKTDLPDLTPAILSNSKEVKVGDIIMAMGNPLGGKQSVSLGIISALDVIVGTNMVLPLIQTDAAINSGNSGGALINLQGEVLAMNQKILSSRGGGQIGLNYAIPIDRVKKIAESIIMHGKVRQNWFGLSAIELTKGKHKIDFPEIKFGTGVFVENIDNDSPAKIAGIKDWDYITRFDEKSFTGVQSFYKVFYSTPLGKKVNVELIREGKLLTLSVQLFEKPEPKQ
jgi:S1-C subfamily serine protease